MTKKRTLRLLEILETIEKLEKEKESLLKEAQKSCVHPLMFGKFYERVFSNSLLILVCPFCGIRKDIEDENTRAIHTGTIIWLSKRDFNMHFPERKCVVLSEQVIDELSKNAISRPIKLSLVRSTVN